jgi:predicted NUDIX family NTP pyrophosphohydrolase
LSKIAKSYSKKVGDSSWTLPGGHIEDNENPVDAAQREAMEELVKPPFSSTHIYGYIRNFS